LWQHATRQEPLGRLEPLPKEPASLFGRPAQLDAAVQWSCRWSRASGSTARRLSCEATAGSRSSFRSRFQPPPGQPKPASAADAAAVVWLVFTREGVTLAADVTEDVVALPESETGVEQKDHLALWLAFPPATLPQMGFQYVQGHIHADLEGVITGASWCDTEEGGKVFDSAEQCRTWVDGQVTRREGLMRLFTRRFLVSSAGVQEAYATAIDTPTGLGELSWPAGCEGCTAKAVPRAGGYSLEARLPLSALPATASDPLDEFRYRIDVSDVDPSGPASVLSTERGRASEVSAQARLDPPRAFESTPPMVGSLVTNDETIFVFPAETVRVVYGFINRLLGYDEVYQVDSPIVAEVKFPDTPAVTVRGVDVYMAPSGTGMNGGTTSELVSFRGGVRVGSFKGVCGDDRLDDVFSKDLGACVLVAFLCSGPKNPVGFGACGACPFMSYEVVAISASGQMASAGESGSFDCGDGGEEVTIGQATNSGFTLRCSGEFSGQPSSERVRWSQFTCPKLPSAEP
jgi:hypothetical protein